MAPKGNGCESPSLPPIAIAVATRLGFSSVLSEIRNAVDAYLAGIGAEVRTSSAE